MRVVIGGDAREFRALWWEDEALWMLDQRRLPQSLHLATTRRVEEVAEAIRHLTVRGTLSVRAAAAYGLALAARQGMAPDTAREVLLTARPGSWDLQMGLARMEGALAGGQDPVAAAQAVADEAVAACRAIAGHGAPLLREGVRVLTHGNAGALATVDHGTALGIVRRAHEEGRRPVVLASETRPRMQGLLTAWEMLEAGVPHEVLPDGACGGLLARGGVDVALVGATRVAANGDVVAKTGTYPLAALAQRHGVPFYVAAPTSAIDPTLADGGRAPIEARGEEEVLHLYGHRFAPAGVRARNPSFDVTPAELVTGYVTEKGILKAHDLAAVAAGTSGRS